VVLWFKHGLLLFWALWLTVITLTNLFDGLKAAGALPSGWRFVSQNFDRVVQAVAVYGAGTRLATVLFGGVILWQGLAAVLFWYAAVGSLQVGGILWPAADLAFTVVLALWAAFIVAEEVFKQYRTEISHVLFFTVQLVSWLALYRLP